MKLITILTSILLSLTSLSQASIQTNFNSTYIGRNQTLSFHYNWERFEIYGGIRYAINKGLHSTDGSFLNKKAHASSSSQHLGSVAGSNYTFLELKNMSFFAFLETQQSYSPILHEFENAVIVTSQSGDEEFAYLKRTEEIGPFWFFENHLGLGYKINVFDGLYLNSRIGGGVMLFKNTDKTYPTLFNKFNWNFSYLLSFGLGYTFGARTEKNPTLQGRERG